MRWLELGHVPNLNISRGCLVYVQGVSDDAGSEDSGSNLPQLLDNAVHEPDTHARRVRK